MRDGRTRETDLIPGFFFKVPIPDGYQEGRKLDRKKSERMKDEYYGLRGWDVVTGFPRRSTLDKLGLDEVAAQMGKLKRLGVEAEGG